MQTQTSPRQCTFPFTAVIAAFVRSAMRAMYIFISQHTQGNPSPH